MFALSFYYGQVISSINYVIAARNAFKVFPGDSRKIAAYIDYLGERSSEVENWKKADKQNMLMTKNLREFRDAYLRAFELAKLPKSSKPEWMSETSFKVLHSLSFPCTSRADKNAHDRLQSEAKEEFIRYYHHINLHTIIDFYRAARAYGSKVRHGKPSGNKFSYGGGPRSSA
jgi:hypothetical protein